MNADRKTLLIFHFRPSEVRAPQDLGLRLGAEQVYGPPPGKEAFVLAANQPLWSPYNSVAARVLWQSRRSAGGTPP